MHARIAADIVVVIHLAFIVFVVCGGLLVLRWPRLAWVHLPAAVWGVAIEFGGWICPLTPLENTLRRAAGDEGYASSFIERYVVPVVYPAGLDREAQFILGGLVLAVNVALYAAVIVKRASFRSRER
jgi:hypothetical protein